VSDVSPIRTATLDDLTDQMGDVAVVVEVVRAYLGELPARRSVLLEAARAGDPGPLVGVAHTLRSSSEMLGGIRLADLARELERHARAGDLAAVRELLPALLGEAGLVERALERWCQRRASPGRV
jgi:HPt (histidine-containing phosphotransfer) domain-containing protein